MKLYCFAYYYSHILACVIHQLTPTPTPNISVARNFLSQIILGVSLFDILGAIAWILSTLPIPKEYENGTPSFIYGAEGNDATCTAQGFLVQLSFTAVFYNISLSAYYFLGKRRELHCWIIIIIITSLTCSCYCADALFLKMFSDCVRMARKEIEEQSLVDAWGPSRDWYQLGFWRDTFLSE